MAQKYSPYTCPGARGKKCDCERCSWLKRQAPKKDMFVLSINTWREYIIKFGDCPYCGQTTEQMETQHNGVIHECFH